VLSKQKNISLRWSEAVLFRLGSMNISSRWDGEESLFEIYATKAAQQKHFKEGGP